MGTPLAAGTRLGRYEIRAKIGEGGMGEVYLAYDTELDRPVAIKFLPAEVAADQRRMQRFTQEAKAASALNHPNILTIYEIVQSESARFFVSEFVDGATLRGHARARQIKLSSILDIAIQITRALVAAHAAGIVHRDIKPENIMIRRDGYVKVLDFGLAKLIERGKSAVDTEAATRALVNTDPGSVMGTVNYMSPEQASGKELDARTDLWSLGVVLYEMLTGNLPFQGQSPSHTVVAILDNEPPPLARYLPDPPESLQEIVADALAKDPEARFQTAKQMLAKLQRLKQRVDAGVSLDHSVAPDFVSHSSGDALTITGPVDASAQPTSGTTAQTTGSTGSVAPTVASASSAEYVAQQIKSHKKPVIAVVAVAGLLILGVAVLLYKFVGGKRSGSAPGQMKISRLVTGLGNVGNASISPDGKYVAYELIKDGKISLRVRQVSTGSDREIVAPVEDGDFTATVFSSDSELVYYNFVQREKSPLGTLYQIPLIGGREPKKILEHLSLIIGFAPDGKRFAFIRDDLKTGDSALMIGSLEGGEPRQLLKRSGQNWFAGVPAWSPDGRRIICPVGTDTGGTQFGLVEVPADGGAEHPLTSFKWHGPVWRPFWLKDGSGLVVNASETSGPTQIWRVSYPDGAVTRVTNDLTEYGTTSFGLTADSSTIVTIAADQSSQIWLAAPNEEEARSKKLTTGKVDGLLGLDWTPDGRVVYVTKTGDNYDIWIMNADGTNQKQLTSNDDTEQSVKVSPDGRYILFGSFRAGGIIHIWRMDIDGSNPKQLTQGDFEDFAPICSPDSKSVVFASWRSGSDRLWKVPIDGGEPVQLSNLPFGGSSNGSGFLQDGKLMFGDYLDEQVNPPRWRAAILSLESGQLVKVFDMPKKAAQGWMPDERTLVYHEQSDGVDNLWSVAVEGGSPKQLTKFTSENIFGFRVTRDGKHFAVVRGTSSADVILIKDFR